MAERLPIIRAALPTRNPTGVLAQEAALNPVSTLTTPERFYRQAEASAFFSQRYGLPVAARSLEGMRTRGGGPSFCKFGRYALYREADLIAWAEARISAPRSSTSAAAA